MFKSCIHWVSVLAIGVALLDNSLVNGSLVHFSENYAACVGETVWLRCATNKTAPVMWSFASINKTLSTFTTYIYKDGRTQSEFAARFFVSPSIGNDDLVIKGVEVKDTGRYTCCDDNGNGECKTAELAVCVSRVTTIIVIVVVVGIFMMTMTTVVILMRCRRRPCGMKRIWKCGSECIKGNEQFEDLLTLDGSLNGDKVFHTKKLHTLHTDGKDVYGIAQLNMRIYVVCRTARKLFVFDAKSFQRLDDIALRMKGVENTHRFEIAACTTTQSLYLSDYNESIWRLTDAGREQHFWLDRFGCDAHVERFSVTSQGHVLLLGDSPPTLYVYKSDPSPLLLHTVKLPQDMAVLNHVADSSLGDESYVVVHGDGEGSLHRVCVVDQDGHVLRCYGGRRGGKDGQLDRPINVAVDSQGYLYVADYYNERVLVFDEASLRVCAILHYGRADRERDYPWRVSYAADSCRLMVGLDSGHVDIYSVMIGDRKTAK